MKFSYLSNALFLVIFIQNCKLFLCFTSPRLDNVNHHGKDSEVKSFREKYALRMKSYMNTSVNPCDDFYEFACGNYPNAIENRETVIKRNNFIDIEYIIMDLIDVTLKKHRQSDEKFSGELEKAKQWFGTCMNSKHFEPKEEYLKVLKSIGGFPAVDPSWNSSTFDWFNMTAHLGRYGATGLVKEKISIKHPFPPYFEIPKFGFGFDAYMENIASKEDPGYVYNEKIMRDLLNLYGVPEAKADKIIEDIIAFWRQALFLEKKKTRFLCKIRPNFDNSLKFSRWSSFFEIAWDVSEFLQNKASICPCHWYYIKLDAIIAKFPEVAANYMALKFLFKMHLQPQEKSLTFQRTRCLDYVYMSFPLLLSHFYMKDHYDKSVEDDINGIISEIKLSMRNIVEKDDWLDESTRIEALAKIRKIRSRIGEAVDPITEVYINEIKKLNLTDNFADNVLKIAKFKVDQSHYGYLHADIPESTLPIELFEALEINAFYYQLDNSFYIMAGILHPPVYHPDLPKSLRYGSLGYILGHEITHALNHNDEAIIDSNLNVRDWWSKESSQAFRKRSNCFTQHYSQYKVPQLMNRKLNGTITLDENIADSGGLKQALTAYRRVFKVAVENKLADFEKNESLSGLDMTPEQTFFLGFAQLYCSDYRVKDYWMEISETNTHPLDKYRVMGSLQNSKEFPFVYNCPLGSPMNPNKKCHLW